MISIQPQILKGHWVQLEPINEALKAELYEAAQDPAIWTFIGSKAYGERFPRWFDKAMKGLKSGQQLPFAVRRLSDHKIIGSTRYYDIHPEHHRLTVGYTWYIPEVWGSYVNPESKYLLFKFAFEELQVNRVEFSTDSRNVHSLAAIQKLGAALEGVLRQHMILEDGYVRDTVMLSVIKTDWPEIKARLEARLERF